MSRFPVSSSKERDLLSLMARLGVKESDLEESFVRSQGAGGQNVNKLSTCVVLRHIPTGFAVKCQQERSRALNRFLARRILLQKIENERLGKLSAEANKIFRLRKQKRRRSKRAKAKMVEGKRKQSEKKQLRRRVHPGSSDW